MQSLPCPLKFTHYFQPTPPHKNLLKTATAEHFLQCQPNSNFPATFYLSLITDAEILQRCQTYPYHCHSSLLAQQSQMCIFPLCQKASCADEHQQGISLTPRAWKSSVTQQKGFYRAQTDHHQIKRRRHDDDCGSLTPTSQARILVTCKATSLQLLLLGSSLLQLDRQCSVLLASGIGADVAPLDGRHPVSSNQPTLEAEGTELTAATSPRERQQPQQHPAGCKATPPPLFNTSVCCWQAGA